jgi:hypothetical protein
MPAKRKRTKAPSESQQGSEVGAQATRAVKDAASVLEQELSQSLPGLRKLSSELAAHQEVNRATLNEVTDKFRSTGHTFIDMSMGAVRELRSEEMSSLTDRITSDAHQMVDIFVDLVGLAAEISSRLARDATPRDGAASVETERAERGEPEG